MSIERCDRCENKIDTDKDADSYVYLKNYERKYEATTCLCQRCRDRFWDEIEYQESA